MTLEDARALDAADPLARFRERFVLPEAVIYVLNGSYLGVVLCSVSWSRIMTSSSILPSILTCTLV